MADERTFIHGYRRWYAIRGIAAFTLVIMMCVVQVVDARALWMRIFAGVIGVMCVPSLIGMVAELGRRRRGTRRIVVGANALTVRGRPIPYGEMRRVFRMNDRLCIERDQGVLKIARVELGTDAEFEELYGLVEERARR